MQWTPGGVSGKSGDRAHRSTSLAVGGTILMLLLSLIFPQDFIPMFFGSSNSGPAVNQPVPAVEDSAQASLIQFVSFVLEDAQRTWERLMPNHGAQYRHAKLVLFRDQTESSCGLARAATGPFYCPADEKVYIDLGFDDELKNRFGTSGEFAQAYVLAHEIGHHVQKLLGISSRVRRLQDRNPAAAKRLSVGLELQADCLAGIWAHETAQRYLIGSGDVESGIQAAASVGDDRIGRLGGGYISPESFRHGSSVQREEWFERGLAKGEISRCNTFSGR